MDMQLTEVQLVMIGRNFFVNMNDGSNEGIRHKVNPWFSSQFHPEARSGSLDTEFLFDKFVDTLK